ncbi:MAG: GNAT family N-acetyltransferase [Candidatus Heimdallarchaeota archaeon]
MIYDPHKFSAKKQFGSDWFFIRPAKIDDKELVWQGYKNAPKEYFNQITEITYETVEQWYPIVGEIDFNQVLPFNVMLLDKKEQEIVFAGNMTLVFRSINRFSHSTMMGVGVLPRFQKRGLGSFLTKLSIDIARAKPNIIRLELNVCASNPARYTYLKYGYKEEGILVKAWQYPDGSFDDVIPMSIIFDDKIKQ